MLRSLHLKDVGPAPELKFEFAERLNILTGDNGLGKTLILEAAWYGLTWTWAGEPILPNEQAKLEQGARGASGFLTAQMDFNFGDLPRGGRHYRQAYNTQAQRWIGSGVTAHASGVDRFEESDHPGDGLVIYARVDGGFSVWDAYKNRGRFPPPLVGPPPPLSYSFDRETVWNGLVEEGRTVCNGLIRDWVSWQQINNGAWHHLVEVLRTLSGKGAESLVPGKPKRVKIEDARDIPTLNLGYGNVPVTQASAGMKRLCALAYMIVWAWEEHRLAAGLRKMDPVRELVLLMDEVEAHLHPAWQRCVLPALLRVLEAIQPDVHVQVLSVTHAPLVLASLEPVFDPARDALFTFDLLKKQKVVVKRAEWRRMGDVSDWLTSDVFDLGWARSQEAEEAINAAIKFLDSRKPTRVQEEQVEADLRRTLGDTDPFWMRWRANRARGEERR